MRRVIVPALLAIAMVASSSVNASAFGLFDKLCNKGCDSCCEPACGCEAACEPTCGCEAACEPACGCEVVDPCCDSGCCGRPKFGGLFSCLFKKHRGCDSCCEPACGCEAAPCCEPACGCEAACEPACGCEVAAPCCDSGCCGKKKFGGLFSCLFKKHRGCDSCCEPACGCEAAPCCEPTCGCEAAPCCEPTCGCEPSCGYGH
jgi:hypothetical protein